MLGQQRGSTGEPDPTPPCALMHTSLFVSTNIGLRTCQSQAGCQRRAPHARRHRQRPAPAGRPHRGPEHASPVSARMCHTNNQVAIGKCHGRRSLCHRRSPLSPGYPDSGRRVEPASLLMIQDQRLAVCVLQEARGSNCHAFTPAAEENNWCNKDGQGSIPCS